MRGASRLKRLGLFLGLFVLAVYLNNTSLLSGPIGDRPVLFAHRAMAQGYGVEGLDGRTCTAARIFPPEHEYLENTIPSMLAAFERGADFVELDVQRTVDGRFAVFHDWTLECRTDGAGVTREHTLDELQRLDVGFGYTADGGKTFPFRGKGVGLMPSLEQVVEALPGRNLVLDVKSNDPEEGELLAARLAELSHRAGEIVVYGGARPVEVVRRRLPELRTMTRPREKRCLTRYLATGWTGYVPEDCRRGLVFVPANVAPWLWGWPNRFLQRMDRAGSRVVLVGDYHGEGFSQGFDDPTRLPDLPPDYAGGIWTDRIDTIAAALDR